MSKITPEIKAEVDKLREEQNKLRAITEGFPSEVEQILYQEAWRVLGKSIKIAPIDTGRLRASARVDMPAREGNTIIPTTLSSYTIRTWAGCRLIILPRTLNHCSLLIR